MHIGKMCFFCMSFDIQGKEPTSQEVTEAKRSVTENIKPMFGTGDAFKLDPNYHKMADLLGLDDGERMDIDLAQKLSYLRDFTGEKEEVDALLKVKQMIRDLGIPTRGKELTKTLYQYARLAKDRERIDKEIQVITNLKKEDEGSHGEYPKPDSQ